MRMTFAMVCAAAALALCLAPVSVVAQEADASELSAEELQALFLTQKTRGLVLAPTGTAEATGTAATEEVAGAVDPASVEPEATSYVELDKSEQVNVRISFDFDSAALREDQKPKLATLCEVIKSIDIEVFRIVGHTDASGSAEYNQRLSLLRAEEVKRFLVSDCGIEPDRLQAVGVGKDFLFDKEDPRSDVNRRVEFQAMS
jgi:OmpA-OmpF porin, OOP family